MSESNFIFSENMQGMKATRSRGGPNTTVFLSDLDRLLSNCANHRIELLRTGKRRLRLKRLLSVLAGVLALLSAGTVAGVLADLLGQRSYQVFAALTAAFSGVITLVTNVYLVDEEIVTIFDAASKYLVLRDLINRVRIAPKLSDEERFVQLEHFQKEYASLDERYSRFL